MKWLYVLLTSLLVGNVQAKESDIVLLKSATPQKIEFSEDGREKKHILLIEFKRGTEPVDPDPIKIQAKAQWIENYWKHYAQDTWDIRVEGYLLYTDCRPLPPYYCASDVNRFIGTNDLGDFDPNYFHVYGGYHASYCGQATLGGNWGVTYNPGQCGVRTMVHELGHNFGWHHGSTNYGGNWVEYGDRNSVMGSGSHVRGLVGPLYVWGDLNEDYNLIRSTQQVILAPLEVNAASLHDNEGRFQQIYPHSGSDQTYSISLRRVLGEAYPATGSAKDLYIHEARRDKHTVLVKTLQPGNSYRTPYGTKIIYLEYAQERARVNVIWEEGDPLPEDIAINLDWVIPENAYISQAHSGAWYAPEFDGQGFDIQIKGNRAAIYWYTYNQGSVERRWYIGTCQLSVCSEGFPLYTTENGTFDNPMQHTVVAAGRAQLYFTSTGNGVFSYNTTEHGRDSIPITAIALGVPDPISGSWYDPDMNGSGITLQRFGDEYAAYWFTYGPDDPYYVDGRSQRWFVAIGPLDNLVVYETLTGEWMWPNNVNLTTIGTASIRQNSHSALTFSYSIDAEDLSSTFSVNMIRLF
jgi:hypothetical protein